MVYLLFLLTFCTMVFNFNMQLIRDSLLSYAHNKMHFWVVGVRLAAPQSPGFVETQILSSQQPLYIVTRPYWILVNIEIDHWRCSWYWQARERERVASIPNSKTWFNQSFYSFTCWEMKLMGIFFQVFPRAWLKEHFVSNSVSQHCSSLIGIRLEIWCKSFHLCAHGCF